MSLLAPLFLLGALAVAVPVWLHRLQTQSSNRQPFSSAMLLETTEEQIHVQKQLKYYLLLAFRIALILLMAAAFAQPFIDRPAASIPDDGAGTTLIVVDTSASMKATDGPDGQPRIEAAKARGAAIVGIFHDVAARDRVCDRDRVLARAPP